MESHLPTTNPTVKCGIMADVKSMVVSNKHYMHDFMIFKGKMVVEKKKTV
jgi:hypothetical protein